MYKKSLFLSPETVNSAHLRSSPLTSAEAQKKSFIFCTSPREYVPFERVFIEYQPIKTRILVNIERKAVEYLAVPKQRLYKAISAHTSSETLEVFKRNAKNLEITHNLEENPENIEKIREETVKKFENPADIREKDEKDEREPENLENQEFLIEKAEESLKELEEEPFFQVSKPSKLSLENPLEENIQGFSEKHGSSASLLRFSQGNHYFIDFLIKKQAQSHNSNQLSPRTAQVSQQKLTLYTPQLLCADVSKAKTLSCKTLTPLHKLQQISKLCTRASIV